MDSETQPGPGSSGPEPDDLSVELDRSEAELDGVEQALARLDAGTYGSCEVCATTLDPAALAGAPTLRRCPVHTELSAGP